MGYFLDYVLYTSISGDEHDLPESYQQLIYATYSKPNRIMPSGMWGPGEPNHPSKTGEPCTFGQAGGKGYGDCWCTWTLHSIICEFPTDDEALKALFEPFGTVTSAKSMMDDK